MTSSAKRFLVITLWLLGGVVPASSDVRNLSWQEALGSAQSACVGRIVELRSESSDLLTDVIVARAKLIEAVVGVCPAEFVVQSADLWEVLQRPHELGYDYLFFLPGPVSQSTDHIPRYEVPHRLVWKQLSYKPCFGEELENFYDPHYVNLPDELRREVCILQRIPHVGSLTHSTKLVSERLLFLDLKRALMPQ